jgi:hypothetical protein
LEEGKAPLIKLNLFENGLDFIQYAIDQIKAESTEYSIKYAVLHLASGIELVLKYRLEREHWSLIFKDTGQANRSALETGDFKSVDFSDCVRRLKNICNITLPEKDARNFENLKDRRNKIIHFNINENVVALRSLFVKVLSSVLNFINRHMDAASFTDNEQDQVNSIRRSLSDFDAFISRRMSEIRNDFTDSQRYSAAVTCPTCFQPTLVLNVDGGGPTCLFCGHGGDPEQLADEYVSDVLHISAYEMVTKGGEYPIYECIECSHTTMVNGEDTWACFNCGTEWDKDDIVFCNGCGTPYNAKDDDILLCGSCIDYRLSE